MDWFIYLLWTVLAPQVAGVMLSRPRENSTDARSTQRAVAYSSVAALVLAGFLSMTGPGIGHVPVRLFLIPCVVLANAIVAAALVTILTAWERRANDRAPS